jgi:cytochrome P450
MQLAGRVVRRGTLAIVPFFTIMRSEREFSDPERFEPRRFLDADNGRQALNKVKLVFSDGARICLGHELAHLEGIVLLAHLVRSFDFATDAPLEFDCGIHCMPNHVTLNASLVARH